MDRSQKLESKKKKKKASNDVRAQSYHLNN